MALPDQPKWTEADYLTFERESDTKHEFIDGQVIAMSGASRRHNLIAGSVHYSLYGQLRGGPCEVYQADMRVNVRESGLYTYPDLVVVCDTPDMTDDAVDTLVNPNVIIEVLSPSTERYDRGKKFQHYRQIPSLQAYVLISQDVPHIETFTRQPDDAWQLREASGLDAIVNIPAIDCTLQLSDVYERVTFDESDDT